MLSAARHKDDETKEFILERVAVYFSNYPTRPIILVDVQMHIMEKEKKFYSSWRTEQQVSMSESCLL